MCALQLVGMLKVSKAPWSSGVPAHPWHRGQEPWADAVLFFPSPAVQEERQRGKDRNENEVESTSSANEDMPVEKILEAELAVEPKTETYIEANMGLTPSSVRHLSLGPSVPSVGPAVPAQGRSRELGLGVGTAVTQQPDCIWVRARLACGNRSSAMQLLDELR